MTDPAITTASTTPAASPKTSFWEDLIDIFFQPVAVFERRRSSSAWPPFLAVTIALIIVVFATFPALQPAIDGDFARTIPRILKANPQLTPEMMSKIQSGQATWGKIVGGPTFMLNVLFDGFLLWLLGKMFSAKEDFGSAVLISSYAFMPRVLGMIIVGAQALIMDPTRLTSMSMLSLSPARFMDPDTTSPFQGALMSRLDLMVIWQTVLLAIGLAVIGKVPRGKAAVFGLTIWIVGSLYALRNAYVIS